MAVLFLALIVKYAQKDELYFCEKQKIIKKTITLDIIVNIYTIV